MMRSLIKTIIRTLSKLILLSLSFAVTAQDQFFPLDDLSGRWTVVNVVENNIDITSKLDPGASRWIEFFNDGFFESDGFPFGQYTGTFVLNELSGYLTLTVEVLSKNSISWKVRHDGDHLRFLGTGKWSAYQLVLDKGE